MAAYEKKRLLNMVSHNRFLFALLLLFLSAGIGWGQSNSYIIYLTDKNGTGGTIDNPSAYLSSKSIEKRNQNSIQIDSTDLPVSQSYLNQISAVGCEVIYTSKWLNAVHIKATAVQYSTILDLPFVRVGSNSFRTSQNQNIHSIESVAQTNYASKYENVLGVTQMHQLGIRGKDIVIAITDAGFPGVDTLTAFKHLYTNNQLLYSFDIVDNNTMIYDDHYHGTAVLSILAAQASNYIGVAPEANYMLLRTENEATESKLEEYNWLRAAEIADSCGADIISVSLGYTTFDNASDSYSYSDMNGSTSVIAYAANMAFDKGMFVVASAGNDGNNSWKYISTPADASNVVTVGSVDDTNVKAGFSSIGPTADGRMKPDVCAPGSVIFYIAPSGAIMSSSGTSLSAPMISGLVAGMMQAFPELTMNEIKSMLFQSCDIYSSPTNMKGFGVPDFNKASLYAHIFTNEADLIVAPNPYQQGQLTLKVPSLNEEYVLNIVDNQGRILFERTYYSNEKLIHIENDFQNLNAGFYFIIIESGHDREILKLIKL